MYYIEEVGHRYGKLVVVEKVDKKLPNRTDAAWLCRCDCGNITIVSGGLLRRQKTLSCGCSKLVDKSGNKYGKLKAIKRDMSKKGYWICECDCGNVISILGNYLQKSGGVSSCGCLTKKIDIPIGSKFFHLTVISESENRINDQVGWTCRCDCGKVVIVASSDLRRGYKQKCGKDCPKFGIQETEADFNVLYSSYKKGAKRRGYVWSLSKDEFKDITSKECYYCGVDPIQGFGRNELNGVYHYNGIDRVDNKIGYEIGNVVPCCKICNIAKHTNSYEFFKVWVIRIYQHWASR